MYSLGVLLLLTIALLCEATSRVAIPKHRARRYGPSLQELAKVKRSHLESRAHALEKRDDTTLSPKIFIISMVRLVDFLEYLGLTIPYSSAPRLMSGTRTCRIS